MYLIVPKTDEARIYLEDKYNLRLPQDMENLGVPIDEDKIRAVRQDMKEHSLEEGVDFIVYKED